MKSNKVIKEIIHNVFEGKYPELLNYINGNKKRNKTRYSTIKVREAYERFASSRILSEAYYKISKFISNCNSYPINIIDLGIGEGVMWKKVLFYTERETTNKINLTGVDYSQNGLNRVLRNISGYSLKNINLIKSNIKRFNFGKNPINNQWLISCLTLHHLKYKDKLGIIKRALNSGIRRITIVEVDYDLENIKDDYLRAYSSALLYRDVFDSIRFEVGQKESDEILKMFYYEELISIMSSSHLEIEERYLPLIEWHKIFSSFGLYVDIMERTYSGVNNIYNIGILDASI